MKNLLLSLIFVGVVFGQVANQPGSVRKQALPTSCTAGISQAVLFNDGGSDATYVCDNTGHYVLQPGSSTSVLTGDTAGPAGATVTTKTNGVPFGTLATQNNPTSGQIAIGLGFTPQNAAVANTNNAGIGNCSSGQYATAQVAGTTPTCAQVDYSQLAGTNPAAAGAALGTTSAQKSANLSDLASASTARTNLGLGNLATQSAPAAGVTSSDGTSLGVATQSQVGFYAAGNSNTLISVNAAGSDAGARIATRMATFQAANGGIVDATGEMGGAINSAIFTGITKPITLNLGVGTWAVNANLTIGGNITLNPSNGAILSPSVAATPTCTTTVVNSLTLTCSSISGLASGQNVRVANGIASGYDFYTSINGAPSGVTVTVANAVPAIITSQTVTARWTLTLSAASINAPPGQQIFDNAAVGAYQLSLSDAVPYVGWWGSDSTGAADSKPAFQAAAYASQASNFSGAGCIYVPNGNYNLLTPVIYNLFPSSCFIGLSMGQGGQGTSTGPRIRATTAAFLEPPPVNLSGIGGISLKNLQFIGGTGPAVVEVGAANNVFLENLSFSDFSGFGIVYVGGVQANIDTISCGHTHTSAIGCVSASGPVFSTYHAQFNALGMLDTDGQIDHSDIKNISDYGSTSFKAQYLFYSNGGIANGNYSQFMCFFSCTTNIVRINNSVNVHFKVVGSDGIGIPTPVTDMFYIAGVFQYSTIEGFAPIYSANSVYTNGLNARGSWIGSDIKNGQYGGDNVTTFGIRMAGGSTHWGTITNVDGSFFSEDGSQIGRDAMTITGSYARATNQSGGTQITSYGDTGIAFSIPSTNGSPAASHVKVSISPSLGTSTVVEDLSYTAKVIYPQLTLGIRSGVTTCGSDLAQLRVCGQIWTPPNTASGTPTVTPSIAGSTRYDYIVVPQYLDGSIGLPSAAGTTSTGFATLDTTHKNTLTYTNPAGAVCANIYRAFSAGTPAGLGLIGSCVSTFADTGQTATTALPTRSTAGDIKGGGFLFGAGFNTNSNCSNTASPAVCGNAAAGQVQVAASATTLQINTTAVTANSRIGCLTYSTVGLTAPTNIASLTQPYVSAIATGASFTLTIPVAPLVSPVNLQYCLIN